MINKKKKTRNKIKTKRKSLNFEISPLARIVLILVSAILALCFLTEGMGRVGDFINDLFYFGFGNGNIIIPILLVFLAINSYLNSIETSDLYLIASAILFLFIGSSFLDSISNQPGVYNNRFSFGINPRIIGINGGYIGGLLNSVLLNLFGNLGLNIILFILFIISVFVFFNLDYKLIGENIVLGSNILYAKSKDVFSKVSSKATELMEKSKEKIDVENLENSKNIKINNDETLNSSSDFSFRDYESSVAFTDNTNEETTEDLKIIEEETLNNDLEKPSKVTPKDKLEIDNEVKSKDAKDDYEFPSIDLLNKSRQKSKINKDEIYENSRIIEDTMRNFGIDAKVEQVNSGPTVTCYELVPAANVKLSKIVGLADNLSFSLASSDIRIEAPIPGKMAVGIEVPNKEKSMVTLEEVINSKAFKDNKSDLPLVLGKDTDGDIVISAIDEMPHLLIAGATGSGKSVCVNSIIISLLYNTSPKDVRMILIDPKIVELGVYNSIPHLLIPVVTNPKKAASTLAWAVEEMERRYKTFAENYVKDIHNYNKKMKDPEDKMSKIVIIIDELADLMMVASNEVEDYIARLAQMARAAGMHLILATQRPSVDVITGTIKANIPSRISFSVSSQVDSRTILDTSGAEKLLGKGDMLFYPSFYSKPRRIQGSFVSQSEVDRVVGFFKDKDFEIDVSEKVIEEINSGANQKKLDADPLMLDAIKLIVYDEQASISYLQRKLSIGYSRAARIVDQLEDQGYVGPSKGSKPRDVFITEEEYLQLLGEDFG